MGTTAVFRHDCDRNRFEKDPLRRLLVHASDVEADLLERVAAQSVRLKEVPVRVTRGEELGKRQPQASSQIPILVGEDISRFGLKEPSRYVAQVEKDAGIYRGPKIVMVKTGAHCVAALDDTGFITMQSVYNLHALSTDVDLRVLLAVLNSTVVDFVLVKSFTAYKLLFPQLNQTTVEELPVPSAISGEHVGLRRLVDEAQGLRKKVIEAQTKYEGERIARNFVALDRAIDLEVAAMYGIAPAELDGMQAAVEEQQRINAFARQKLEAMSGLMMSSQPPATLTTEAGDSGRPARPL